MLKEGLKVIGFAGRMRSGKTTLANVLVEEYGAVRLSFANALKELCCEGLMINMEELNRDKCTDKAYYFDENTALLTRIANETGIAFDDVLKEFSKCPKLTMRDLLQVVGTNIIRKHCPTWHIEKTLEAARSVPSGKMVTIDDIRFWNEVEAVEGMDGSAVFMIIRPSFLDRVNCSHPSENSLSWKDFRDESVIINDGLSLEEFKSEFLDACKEGYLTVPCPVEGKSKLRLIDRYGCGEKYYKVLDGMRSRCSNPLIKEDLKLLYS